MSQEAKYNIQFTVFIYKKKYYISNIAAIALGDKMEFGNTLMFGNRTLIAIRDKDKHLIDKFPLYNIDSALGSFINPGKNAEVHKINKKACFTFDGMTFISLSKLQIKNKYHLRFSLPSIKIFGTYYILCGKQKDVNTRIVVIPE